MIFCTFSIVSISCDVVGFAWFNTTRILSCVLFVLVLLDLAEGWGFATLLLFFEFSLVFGLVSLFVQKVLLWDDRLDAIGGVSSVMARLTPKLSPVDGC